MTNIEMDSICFNSYSVLVNGKTYIHFDTIKTDDDALSVFCNFPLDHLKVDSYSLYNSRKKIITLIISYLDGSKKFYRIKRKAWKHLLSLDVFEGILQYKKS